VHALLTLNARGQDQDRAQRSKTFRVTPSEAKLTALAAMTGSAGPVADQVWAAGWQEAHCCACGFDGFPFNPIGGSVRKIRMIYFVIDDLFIGDNQ